MDKILTDLPAGAQQVFFAAADGTQLSLDQLMSGALLPRIVELRSLKEMSARLLEIPESKALSAVADFRIDKLVRELSPAEVVQMALRPDFHQFDGNANVSIPLRLMGPDGVEVDFADLLTNPIYPAVNERIAWGVSSPICAMNKQKALASFCHLKADVLAQKMSEAERVQFRLMLLKQRSFPHVEPFLPSQFNDGNGNAFTLSELKDRPLSAPVQSLESLWQTISECRPKVEATDSIIEKARLTVEGHAAACEASRLLTSLSDAELMRWILPRK